MICRGFFDRLRALRTAWACPPAPGIAARIAQTQVFYRSAFRPKGAPPPEMEIAATASLRRTAALTAAWLMETEPQYKPVLATLRPNRVG